MSVMAVTHLYLAGTGNRKSFCRCLMCLDLSHFYILLFDSRWANFAEYIIKICVLPPLFMNKNQLALNLRGVITMLINLPSSIGALSTFPNSLQSSSNFFIIS